MESQHVFIFPQCGGEALGSREGHTDGLLCTQCDWLVATTYTPPIQLDRTIYEVRIEHGTYQDVKLVKAIAHVIWGNFLSARGFLKNEKSVMFSGDAQRVMQVRDLLFAVGFVVAIQPEFPW